MPTQTKPQTPTNRGKFLFYIVEAIAFLAIIIVAILLTFMRKTTPKLRLQSLTIQTLTINRTSPPSCTIKFNAQFTVKNSNYGKFRFADGKIAVFYQDSPVGDAVIPGGRAKARSSEKMNVTVTAELNGGDLGGDLKSGMITLRSDATLRGKIRVIGRKATAKMNCTMDVNTTSSMVQDLKCS